LILSQDPSEAKNSEESTDSEKKESKGSKESSENKLPTVLQLVPLSREQPIQKKRQQKDYTNILPPSSVLLRTGRQRSKKFDSQNAHDGAATAAKEGRKKARELKASSTGTRRTKKQEVLAIASQLMDTQLLDRVGVELPLRSSQ
jgi:hypothetical protein